MIGLIFFYLIHENIITTKGIQLSEFFPFDLSFNCFWFIYFVGTLIGLFFLFKHSWFDLTWVLILIICKSLIGHPSEFPTTLLLTFFNSIHIAAASIWVAGLLFIFLYWRKQKLTVKNFIHIFAEYVVFCMVVLAITGSSLAYIYLPDIYLFLQPWGLMIILKTLLVAILAFFGIYMKQMNRISFEKWLYIQFVLMFTIIIFISIITYIQPIQ